MSIVINILLAIHVMVSLFIIFFVLMQRPKSEGLGAAFGGGMTENLFGAGATNALQTITRWLGGIFFGLTLLLSMLYIKQTHVKSSLEHRLTAPTVIPKDTATPAPSTPGVPPPAIPSAPDSATSPTTETPAPASPEGAAPAKPESSVTTPVKPESSPPAAPAPAAPEPAPSKPESPAPAK